MLQIYVTQSKKENAVTANCATAIKTMYPYYYTEEPMSTRTQNTSASTHTTRAVLNLQALNGKVVSK
jgi:hypothetical protein